MKTVVKKSRKQQIEQKATILFQERGYAATSMRDLAQVLGIEAASLYSHIKSKEEILQKICFRMAKEFFKAWQEVELETTSFSSKMEKAMIAHVKVITKDTDASAVFFNEWRHLSEPYLGGFFVNDFRYGARLQIGIDSFDMFMTYDFNELFEDGRGPQLNPITIGVVF